MIGSQKSQGTGIKKLNYEESKKPTCISLSHLSSHRECVCPYPSCLSPTRPGLLRSLRLGSKTLWLAYLLIECACPYPSCLSPTWPGLLRSLPLGSKTLKACEPAQGHRGCLHLKRVCFYPMTRQQRHKSLVSVSSVFSSLKNCVLSGRSESRTEYKKGR